MRLKLSGSDLETPIAQPLGEKLIKPLGVGGKRGTGKGRPVAFAAVGVQRELRDHEQLAAGVDNRAIHFALLVCENAQVRNLVAKRLRTLFVVLFADAQENAQARTDFSNDFVSHGYTSFADSLKDDAHVGINAFSRQGMAQCEQERKRPRPRFLQSSSLVPTVNREKHWSQ